MKTTFVFLIIGLVVVLFVGGFFLVNSIQANSLPTQNVPSQNSKMKFSDMRGANKAFLISGDSIDSNTQAALSGFQYSKDQNSDGSLKVTLKALNPEYTDQVYTVLPGQKLYFIENSMGDDSPPNVENTLADDHAVLVDSDGYVVTKS